MKINGMCTLDTFKHLELVELDTAGETSSSEQTGEFKFGWKLTLLSCLVPEIIRSFSLWPRHHPPSLCEASISRRGSSRLEGTFHHLSGWTSSFIPSTGQNWWLRMFGFEQRRRLCPQLQFLCWGSFLLLTLTRFHFLLSAVHHQTEGFLLHRSS